MARPRWRAQGPARLRGSCTAESMACCARRWRQRGWQAIARGAGRYCIVFYCTTRLSSDHAPICGIKPHELQRPLLPRSFKQQVHLCPYAAAVLRGNVGHRAVASPVRKRSVRCTYVRRWIPRIIGKPTPEVARPRPPARSAVSRSQDGDVAAARGISNERAFCEL